MESVGEVEASEVRIVGAVELPAGRLRIDSTSLKERVGDGSSVTAPLVLYERLWIRPLN